MSLKSANIFYKFGPFHTQNASNFYLNGNL